MKQSAVLWINFSGGGSCSAAEETRWAHTPASQTASFDSRSVTQTDSQPASQSAKFKLYSTAANAHVPTSTSVTSNHTDLHTPTIASLFFSSSFPQYPHRINPAVKVLFSTLSKAAPTTPQAHTLLDPTQPSICIGARATVHAANHRAPLSVSCLTAHSVTLHLYWICSVSQKAHATLLSILATCRNLCTFGFGVIPQPTSPRSFRSPTVSSDEGRQAFQLALSSSGRNLGCNSFHVRSWQ